MTKNEIIKNYNLYKNYATNAYKNSDYSESILSLKYACELAYAYNWQFSDYQLEELVIQISRNFKTEKIKNIIPNKRRIIFYDFFAISNCGLTQQYLRALVKLDFEILFLVPKTKKEIDENLLNEILSYKTVSVKFISSNNDNIIESINLIIQSITDFCPSKAFLHMSPWDVVGNVVWNLFPSIERFQINITDHAFWLGISCADYFLEFRNFGYNVSKEFRHIPKEKIFILPYYPICDLVTYNGIPEKKNYIKLFSGGAMYKIYGYNLKYLDIIKDILIRNPNTIFYYAGAGDYAPMEAIIKKFNLQDRWILLGFRKDIVEVMKHIDIYIGTYPLGGGLISQIAATLAKPCVCYHDPRLLNFSNVQQLFNSNIAPKISFNDLSEFNTVLDRLINSSQIRQNMGKKLQLSLPTVEEFEEGLFKIIKGEYKSNGIINDKIASDELSDLYLELNNKLLHSVYRININKTCLKINIIIFVKSLLCYVYFLNKKYLLFKFKQKYLKNIIKVLNNIYIFI